MWPPFLYAPSPLDAALTAAGAAGLVVIALPEFLGRNLAYSKIGVHA